jgi:ribosome-binding factor A
MAEAIREVIASAILFEVADPRVREVTVLRVEMSPDLRIATVHVSIMGEPSERKHSFRGLVHASGFLQAKMAARLQTRFTPTLVFKHDDSVKKSIEVTRLIEEAVAADQASSSARGGSVASAPAGARAGSLELDEDPDGDDEVPESS